MAQNGTRAVRTAALRGMTPAEVRNLAVMVPLDDSNRALNIGRTVGYTLARQGEYPVPVHRLGNQYRVARSDLLRFLGISDPAGAQTEGAAA